MAKSNQKQIIVTSALPYSNGSIHVGHLVEYIQTDIFVRFLKLIGKNALYCCADDTHGTPIQISAEKEGILPEQLIDRYHKEHLRDFTTFSIRFDSYYSTNSKENKLFSELIFRRLQEKELIYQKEVELSYCEKCKRFLPDRYIRGTCPKCKAKDQYGDVCESCNNTHATVDLVDPFCTICGTPPIKKTSDHYFFKLSNFQTQLTKWFENNKKLQPEIKNYLKNWIKEGLQDWDITRDGPYFGFNIPGEKDKYFYVWLDAPIGYISSFTNAIKKDIKQAEKDWNNAEIIHFIGKDITYFHFLFWPAVLMGADFKLPDYLVVHGFLTVNGEKMSKSRGTFFTAEEFASKYHPEFLRFYYAKSLSKRLADIDLDFNDFQNSINNELVGNLANFCYRVLSFTNNKLQSSFKEIDPNPKLFNDIGKKVKNIKKAYEDVNTNEAVKEILAISDLGNQYFQKNQPWKVKDEEQSRKILGTAINIVKVISIIVKPILPKFAEQIQKQLNVKDACWDDIDGRLKNHKIKQAEIILNKIEGEIPTIKTEEARIIETGVEDDAKQLGINAAFIQLQNVNIKKKHEGLEKIKETLAAEIKQGKYQEKKHIEGYKELYHKCGVKGYNYGAEHLIKLIKEKGKLPTINTLVDAYNVVAAQHKLSIGAHDVNKIKGKVSIKLAEGNEKYIPLGENELQKVKKGEYICADDDHVMCWLDVKQSNFTFVDNKTKNVLLYIQGNNNISQAEVNKFAKEAAELVTKFCGGSYDIEELAFPLDLKIAKIEKAEDHPDADKLIVMDIDLGEKRHIVAGLKDHYKTNELEGKTIIVVANLEKAKLRGVESQAMLLAADDGKTIEVLETEGKPGDKVTFGNLKNDTKQISFQDFQKLEITVKNKEIFYNNRRMEINAKPIIVKKVKEGARIR